MNNMNNIDTMNNIDNNIDSQPNINLDSTDINMEYQVLTSYMDFISTSTMSIHSMIEIINNQQGSFNQILGNESYTTETSCEKKYTTFNT